MKNKYAFLINSFGNGGAEKVTSLISSELSRDSEVHLIFLEKNQFYSINPKVHVKYLTTSDDSVSPIIKILALPYLALLLGKYCKANGIHTVTSHLYRSNYVNILCKMIFKFHKSIIVNHGTISRYKKEGLLGRINLFLIALLYKKADLIIWVSSGMYSDFKSIFSYETNSIVINNPYDVNALVNLAKENVDDFDFDPKKYYMISVGRLIQLKRIETILHALCSLKNEYNDIELLLVGDGPRKQELKSLAQGLGIESKVHFIGRVMNPYKYISKADLLVMASESEGFPNVIIEALACQCPIISSDCSNGPREILAPDTNLNSKLKEGVEVARFGVLFAVGDVPALARGIGELYENRLLVEQYISTGLGRALDFDKEIIIKKYIDSI